ncbi:putative disease resistance protein rdl6 [Quercus suber]|uniref:Disease resistance protein rdl6 n=1 Tax=Quercus suber TaxID=58331 RepID=A0AAW0J3S9_QUESU
MADSVVSFLLQNLTQLLTQESKLLGGVEDQVKLLKNELSLINVFLQNTEGKRHDKLVKEVVSQIRDVAYEAEDVIDTFITTVTKHRRRRSKLRKLIHSCDRAIAFHEVASKIESIKNIIKEIYENRSKYGIEIAESSGGDAEVEEILRRRRRYVEEDQVELVHDLEAMYRSNDKLKGTMKVKLEVSINEMNDEEFRKAWLGFLECILDHDLKKLLSGYVQDFYRKNDISSNPCEPSNCRSLITFGGVDTLEIPLDKSYLKRLCKSNKLVRVVELMNMGICCLIPNEIENLILLRYLSIQSCRLHVIPDSICNLWNLEMLDMRNSTIKSKFLPKGIWKLQKLRHLYLNGSTCLPRTDNRVGLPNLQVLTGIVINQVIESLFAKDKFPSVRKLGLYSLGLTDSTKSGLLSSLLPLRHLQTLKTYRLSEFSRPISVELTLTKITIVCTSLSSGVMRVLSSLTNLRVLKLVGTINEGDSKMTVNCDENSFHQLEVFKMANIDVSEWTMGKGAMPSLQRLVIERCEFSEMPLNKLWRLTALQDVEVLHPSPKLAMMLKRLQMRDGCKLYVYPPLYPTTN